MQGGRQTIPFAAKRRTSSLTAPAPRLRFDYPEIICFGKTRVDEVDQMVEQSIAHTVTILERMRKMLEQDFPGHPALEKLQAFLDQLDRFSADRSLH